MKVRFKGNSEPCVQYRVLNNTPVIEYDEVLGKYCACIEIEALGLVPLEMLCETTCNENVDAIDIVVHLKS
jgi:hypothetical protein